MARRSVQVHRFHRITPDKMDTVETLRKFDPVLVVGAVTNSPPMIQIRDIRRAGDLTKRRISFPKHQGAIFVTRSHYDPAGGFGNLFHD